MPVRIAVSEIDLSHNTYIEHPALFVPHRSSVRCYALSRNLFAAETRLHVQSRVEYQYIIVGGLRFSASSFLNDVQTVASDLFVV
jgi:hypothetical protein